MHYLFLVRHYPPEISGGARRPFLLVRALRRIGYKITLVTPFNVEDDPDHICVIGSASNAISDISSNKSTFNIFSNFKNVMRIWFLWPDADILWAKRVERAVIKSGITPDGIFTTSHSESIHIVGSRLAKRLNVHWVAEFRDTWFHNPHRKILERSMLRRFVERLIARRALKYVSGLTAVSRYVMNDILTFAPVSVPHKIIEMAELVKERSLGALVEQENPEDIAKVIRDVIKRSDKISSKIASQKLNDEFGWLAQVTRLNKLYANLLK